jgi:hypothetical protein
MAFKKGESGNKKGRPAGTPNRVTSELREMISDFLQGEFETVKNNFKNLQPKEQAKVYCDLLQYGLPRLSNVSSQFDFENLTDQQLDYLLDQLKQAGNETE